MASLGALGDVFLVPPTPSRSVGSGLMSPFGVFELLRCSWRGSGDGQFAFICAFVPGGFAARRLRQYSLLFVACGCLLQSQDKKRSERAGNEKTGIL